MSDLPDDSRDWPSDPFRLLGIDRTADAKKARRAYFKLVKQFKPDKCPEEFQLIRAAYEEVEQWLSWNTPDPDNNLDGSHDSRQAYEPPSPDDTHDAPLLQSSLGESSRIQPDNTSPNTFQPSPFDRFIELLQSGDVKSALVSIQEINNTTGPHDKARAALTCYLLSRIKDDLVPAQDEQRIQWLLDALQDEELFHAALHLLRGEFDRNYKLANSVEVNTFLQSRSNDRRLGDIYKLRWEAIGHTERQVVVNDIEHFKNHNFEFQHEPDIWVDLLAASMEYTVWHTDERCMVHNRESWREISESQQSWTADSVELMILAADEWQKMRSMTDWSSALPWARNSLPGTMEQIWTPVAQSIAANRIQSLDQLSHLYRRFTLAMSYFEDGLRQLADTKPDPVLDESWDEARALIAGFFSNQRRLDYSTCRNDVLEFCVLNQLSPHRFAHAASSFLGNDSIVNWVELVQNDGPLLCVFHASIATSI